MSRDTMKKVAAVVALGVVAGLVATTCERLNRSLSVAVPAQRSSSRPTQPAVSRPPPAPREPTLGERVAAAGTLTEALAILKPGFAPATTESDPVAILFSMWASKRMTWAQLKAVQETKYGSVMKDPVAEQGKRLCSSGSVVEIEVDRSSGEPIYIGGLISTATKMTRFLAVGSTSGLVESSIGRICGIVTGKYSYANSGGGTTHSVHVVGMFDLPENRAPAK